jgi:hypothetical protein
MPKGDPMALVGEAMRNCFGYRSTLAKESLLVGGWVAMWRPLQIFLYESCASHG